MRSDGLNKALGVRMRSIAASRCPESYRLASGIDANRPCIRMSAIAMFDTQVKFRAVVPACARQRSSSSVTSRTSCQRLSMVQCARTSSRMFAASACAAVREVTQEVTSWDSLPDLMVCRRRSIRATCARPTIAMRCACSGVLTSSTVHRRHSRRPWPLSKVS